MLAALVKARCGLRDAVANVFHRAGLAACCWLQKANDRGHDHRPCVLDERTVCPFPNPGFECVEVFGIDVRKLVRARSNQSSYFWGSGVWILGVNPNFRYSLVFQRRVAALSPVASV